MRNADCYLEWNGQESGNIGDIVVTKSSINDLPRRKYNSVSVPGRNGDIIFYQDAWENITRSWEIVAGNGQDGTAVQNYRNIASWLMPEETEVTIDKLINLETGGYHRLIDGGDPDGIMLAYFTGPVDVENILSRAGRATINFSCRPERFTNDAFTMLTVSSTGEAINNPTDRPAKPFIKVYGSGSAALMVNGYQISISNMTDYLHIDCDSQNCFRQLAENRNNLITLTNGFPVLTSGGNAIAWTGGIDRVEIYPRWWKL